MLERILTMGKTKDKQALERRINYEINTEIYFVLYAFYQFQNTEYFRKIQQKTFLTQKPFEKNKTNNGYKNTTKNSTIIKHSYNEHPNYETIELKESIRQSTNCKNGNINQQYQTF